MTPEHSNIKIATRGDNIENSRLAALTNNKNRLPITSITCNWN